MLITIAARLRLWLRGHSTEARADDVITRIGADHFVVLCENAGGEQAAATIAGRLLDVDDSGHHIQLDRPDVVIDQIEAQL